MIIQKPGINKDFPGLKEMSEWFDTQSCSEAIGHPCWKEFPYRPEVTFKISYTSGAIFLKYHVRESFFKAGVTEINQRVWEDSCVEFFVSPGMDDVYYNFEFNGIGTCFMGSGTGRHDTAPAPLNFAFRVLSLPSIGTAPVRETEGDIYWELTVAIPAGVFFRHRLTSFNGMAMRGNFYKCGDGLKKPHYLAWKPVLTEKPDFHRPEFFGELLFA